MALGFVYIYFFIYLISKASFRQRRIQKRIGVAAKHGTVKIKPGKSVYGRNRCLGATAANLPASEAGKGQDTMEQLDKNPCTVFSFSPSPSVTCA